MLRKLNTCFSCVSGKGEGESQEVGGEGRREVWKNDFSAICWRPHLDRYSTTIFCQEKIRGGEVELLGLKEREGEREKETTAVDFDELISFGFIRQTDRRFGWEGWTSGGWGCGAQLAWTNRRGRGPTVMQTPVDFRRHQAVWTRAKGRSANKAEDLKIVFPPR